MVPRLFLTSLATVAMSTALFTRKSRSGWLEELDGIREGALVSPDGEVAAAMGGTQPPPEFSDAPATMAEWIDPHGSGSGFHTPPAPRRTPGGPETGRTGLPADFPSILSALPPPPTRAPEPVADEAPVEPVSTEPVAASAPARAARRAAVPDHDRAEVAEQAAFPPAPVDPPRQGPAPTPRPVRSEPAVADAAPAARPTPPAAPAAPAAAAPVEPQPERPAPPVAASPMPSPAPAPDQGPAVAPTIPVLPSVAPAPHRVHPEQMWHPDVVPAPPADDEPTAEERLASAELYDDEPQTPKFRFARLRAVGPPTPDGLVSSTAGADEATDPMPAVPRVPSSDDSPGGLIAGPVVRRSRRSSDAPRPGVTGNRAGDHRSAASAEPMPFPPATPDPSLPAARHTVEPTPAPGPAPQAPAPVVEPTRMREPAAVTEPVPSVEPAPVAAAPVAPTPVAVAAPPVPAAPVVETPPVAHLGPEPLLPAAVLDPEPEVDPEPVVVAVEPEPQPEPEPTPAPVAPRRLDVAADGTVELEGGHLRLAPGPSPRVVHDATGTHLELGEGWCWVALGPDADPVSIELTMGTLTVPAGCTALAVVEPDGATFLAALAGAAGLTAADGPSVLPVGTVVLATEGGPWQFDRATADELAADPVVARNRELDAER